MRRAPLALAIAVLALGALALSVPATRDALRPRRGADASPPAAARASAAPDAGALAPAQSAWTRVSRAGTCLPEIPLRYLEVNRFDPQSGVWLRYDDEDGRRGAGRVLVVDARGTEPWTAFGDLAAAIEAAHTAIQRQQWGSLRDFWAVTRETGTLVWAGPRHFDGARWSVLAQDEEDPSFTRSYDQRALPDRAGEAWVPMRLDVPCADPSGCGRDALQAFDARAATGAEIDWQVVADAARYGLPDLHMLPDPDPFGVGSLALGHTALYRLPLRDPQAIPGIDPDDPSRAGYATAALRLPDGRVELATWVETRDARGLRRDVFWIGQDAAGGWQDPLALTDSKLFEGQAAYDRVVAADVAPGGGRYLATYSGRVGLFVEDAQGVLQLRSVEEPAQIGLREQERILDLAADADDVLWLATTEGLLANRDVAQRCPADVTSVPTEPTPTEPTPASATPSATATGSPPIDTPTPSPTATRPAPPPQALYIPATLQEGCLGRGRPLDVVLLVDVSAPMRAQDPAAGRRRIDWAAEAALAFAEGLDEERDQLGVIAYEEVVNVLARLSLDRRAWISAISELPGALSASEAARMDLALTMAPRELLLGGRPGALGVIVLLGDQARGAASARVLENAGAAKDLGYRIATVGYGPETDRELLSEVASPELGLRYASDGPTLVRAMSGLPADLHCGIAAPSR